MGVARSSDDGGSSAPSKNSTHTTAIHAEHNVNCMMDKSIRAWVPALAAVALLWAAQAWSGSPEANQAKVRKVVKTLQATYRNTKDLQADFTQQTRIEGFATPLTSRGRLYIKKPGRLRWDYHEPSVEQIYVNKSQVQMYVPAHEQVLIGDLTRMTASRAPLRLLQGVGKLEEEFDLAPTPVLQTGADGLPLVTLLPKTSTHESVQNVARIVLEVQPKTYYIKTLHIHEISGNVSTFEFSNLQPNTGLKDDLFEFTVPPGVEVVQAPALRPP